MLKKLIDELSHPTLLLDEQILLANVRRMIQKAMKAKVIFRPHFKTHQSRTIGQIFRSEGVDKITVSSIPMAKYFAEDGWKDICIAMPVNLREKKRLEDLSQIHALHLVVEASETLDELVKVNWINPPSLFIKIDAGYGRTGIAFDNVKAIQQLLDMIDASGLGLSGLLLHMGNTYSARSATEVKKIYLESSVRINTLRKQLRNGSNLYISMGDTPSCSVLDSFQGFDEIRPGNFVFYDVTQHAIGSNTLKQIAVCLAVPVLAIHAERNEILAHGGAIHLAKDSLVINGKTIYGQMVLFEQDKWLVIENAYVTKISQEHGSIKVPEPVFSQIQLGSVVGILPVHSCMTANLMASYTSLTGKRIDHMNQNPPEYRF